MENSEEKLKQAIAHQLEIISELQSHSKSMIDSHELMEHSQTFLNLASVMSMINADRRLRENLDRRQYPYAADMG